MGFTPRFCLAARGRWVILWAFCLLGMASPAHAQAPATVPLNQQIDQLLSRNSTGIQANLASDAEFLRRVSLDLTGMPPSAAELRTFLQETSPDKRVAAVDRLLNSPSYARHFSQLFDVMLMERRNSQQIPAKEWENYLLTSFQANKSFQQLAREILSADGADPQTRAAARFYIDRGGEPNLITRDVGRIFLGRDLQCAQCHNHPLIDDYHQADYHGILAFLAPGYLFTAPEPDKKVYFGEKAGSDLTYESVFVKGVRRITGAAIPEEKELVEPTFAPGDEYEVRPTDATRGVPKFSRRKKFAELVTSGKYRPFNENIANRLWGMMMGRGLVHPVDLHHSANPPSNPELLSLLGREFAAMGFDIRKFVREIALTRVYQTSIDFPALPTEATQVVAPRIAELETLRETQQKQFEAVQTQLRTAEETWSKAQAAANPVFTELEQARAKGAEAFKKFSDAQKAADDLTKQRTTKEEAITALNEASTKAQIVAQKLPADIELVQAAAKFADRLKQFSGELDGLKQKEQAAIAGLKAPTDELTAAKQNIDSVSQKYAPLQAAVRTADEIRIPARVAMEREYTLLQSHEHRLRHLRGLDALNQSRKKIEDLTADLSAKQTSLVDSQQKVTEMQPRVNQQAQEHQTAQQNHGTAIQMLTNIKAEHSRQKEAIASVMEAIISVESAMKKVPDDSTLKEAHGKLVQKRGELEQGLADHQKQVDQVATAVSFAAERESSTKSGLDAVMAELTSRQKQVAEIQSAIDASLKQRETLSVEAKSLADTLEREWNDDFTVAGFKALSPEQMLWSVYQVTGVLDNYVQAEVAEMDKTAPMTEEQKKDPAQVEARRKQLEQRVFDKLGGNLGTFVNLYGAGPGQPQQDFFATVDQALFVANAGTVNSWVGSGSTFTRLSGETDVKKIAEEMYLSYLSRMPTEIEIKDVSELIASRPADQKGQAIRELCWGLVTSVEFRFNH